jgi:hypothetical protein
LDEGTHDAVLCGVNCFASGNRHDFLTCAGFFQNRSARTTNQITQANGIKLLDAANWDGFALPNEHPPGPFANVSDGGEMGASDFNYSSRAWFLARAYLFPTSPDYSPIKAGDGLAGKITKVGELSFVCEGNCFVEVSTKKINRVAQRNLSDIMHRGIFPGAGAT